MEVIKPLEGISIASLLLLYAIIALGAFHILKRFGPNRLTIFIVLVFWEGLFAFLETLNILNYDYFKILIFVYGVVVFGPNILKKNYKTDRIINISFLLFSISFWLTFILNEQSFVTIASQYGKKFAVPFLFYHGIKDMLYNYNKAQFNAKLLIAIIYLQIGFSIVKVIAIGSVTESIVGSVQYRGGGAAVVFPILSFFLIYISKKGIFKVKDWLSVFPLLIIAIVSSKRAPIFIFPITILIVLVYVQRSMRLVQLLKFIPIGLILFYIGVKTNPSLNPEGTTWGRFDLGFTYNYAKNYYFGTEDLNEIRNQSRGYGSSILLVFSPGSFNFRNGNEFLFGRGLEDVVTKAKGKFFGKEYGYDWEGRAGYAVRHIYTLGYSGLIFYLFFGISIIWIINNKRFRNLVLGFFLWEFFFYGCVTLTFNAMAILLVFICVYYNAMYPNNKLLLEATTKRT